MAQAFVIDTHIFDKLEEDQAAREAFTSSRRSMRVIVTHIQRDQLEAIPDRTRRDRLLGLLAYTEMVPTHGFVLDVSPLDGPAHLTEHPVAVIEVVGHVETSSRRLERLKDGLLASTALRDDAILVTEDQQLRSRVGEAVVVWNWATFRDALLDASHGREST